MIRIGCLLVKHPIFLEGQRMEEDRKWASDLLDKIILKIKEECLRHEGKIPYMAEKGEYSSDMKEEDIAWWTNGFWGGILWQLYQYCKEPIFKERAQVLEEQLDQAISDYDRLYHDVGFMWLHTAVANYRLTGNVKSLSRGRHAANLLAGRFNCNGNFIRAWNEDKTGWMIVDCLMNLPLLYWASKEQGDPRFEEIAKRHADTAWKYILRSDGSCNHIVVIDPYTGEFVDSLGGQGYANGSSWSRGHAWAIYGFVMSYKYTDDMKYLDASKQVAHYFIANIAQTDFLPLSDFRAPENPVYYDSTAGVCAACGLLELAKLVPETERRLYYQSALRMLKKMEEKFCDFSLATDGILKYGKVAYHDGQEEANISLIYGDYFLIEAVLKILDQELWIW